MSKSSWPNAASRSITSRIYRWVQRFTPLVIEAARSCRHSVGDRWFVDETYVKVAGVWRLVYRAVDQHGQVIDVLVSKRRNIPAANKFFETMLVGRDRPTDVATDLAAPLLRVVDNLLPEVLHHTSQYANNRIECDHGRLKARLRPMRGLRTDRTATVVMVPCAIPSPDNGVAVALLGGSCGGAEELDTLGAGCDGR